MVRRRAPGRSGRTRRSAPVRVSTADALRAVADHRFAREPFPHQREGVLRLLQEPCFGLFDDLGLGKTATASEVVRIRRASGQIARVLIVAPLSLFETWTDEIRRGDPAARIDLIARSKDLDLRSSAPFTVVNYEKLDRLAPRLLRGKFDQLVMDEAHRTRNYGRAKVARGALRLAKGMTKGARTLAPIPYRLVLTGTPYGDRPEHVWMVASLVRPGCLGGRSEFIRRHCAKGGFQEREIIGYQDLAALKERVASISLRRSAEEVGGLPERIAVTRLVDLLPEQARAYRELRDRLRTTLRGMDDRTLRLEAKNVLAQFTRLQQIASDLACVGGRPLSAKRRELGPLIEEALAGGHKAVVWSLFVPTISLVAQDLARCGAVVLDGRVPPPARGALVRRFHEDPKQRVLVAHPRVGGEGLSLTCVRTAVFVDQTPSGLLEHQVEQRCRRLGMNGSVTIVRLHARGSIDIRYGEIASAKRDLGTALTEPDEVLRRLGRERLLALLD